MTKIIDDLIYTICGDLDQPLRPFLRRWCNDSRPFVTFAQTYASKIRKKARLAPSADEQANLLAELAVAAFLVRDRRCNVTYEPYLATGLRGPDFQVTFKTHSVFHVEVTRLRLRDAPVDDLLGTPLKLARVLCDKIGQFPTGTMNVLAVVVPPGTHSDELVPSAIRLLEGYTQPQNDLVQPELRPDNVQIYLRQRQRLSAVMLCPFNVDWALDAATIWRNQHAKHPLLPEINRLLAQAS